MKNEQPNDDLLFDRLVDGELNSVERRAVLESLATRPDGWRRCAIAFLEAQAWHESLSALSAHHRPNEAENIAPLRPCDQPLRARHASAWQRRAQWLAIAASLVVAFKVGALQRESASQLATTPNNSGAELAQSASPPPANVPASKRSADALNLWVRDDGGQMRRVRVPLVDAAALEQQLGLQFQTGFPDELRNRLKSQGYTVQSKRQYAPLWLDNGQPMIVPVEDTRIVPVSNKVY